jgi:hypothetical protein
VDSSDELHAAAASLLCADPASTIAAAALTIDFIFIQCLSPVCAPNSNSGCRLHHLLLPLPQRSRPE